MIKSSKIAAVCAILTLLTVHGYGQIVEEQQRSTLYDVPPRRLVDMPTAGTLPRGHYDLGLRVYYNGGGMGYCNIGLSSRFMLGVSYGANAIFANVKPTWNDRPHISLKFRIVDELEYLPGIAVGFSGQGQGPWLESGNRYTYKSRGFYGVVSRSFYFYKWTSGWHAGINYSTEEDVHEDDDINLFLGFDATFNYNLALMLEYDFGLNDDKSGSPHSGKGRGYLNFGIKWLFTDNLEIELIAKDLLVNRSDLPEEADQTFARELRITYIDRF